jgi:hypothetical protein
LGRGELHDALEGVVHLRPDGLLEGERVGLGLRDSAEAVRLVGVPVVVVHVGQVEDAH